MIFAESFYSIVSFPDFQGEDGEPGLVGERGAAGFPVGAY